MIFWLCNCVKCSCCNHLDFISADSVPCWMASICLFLHFQQKHRKSIVNRLTHSSYHGNVIECFCFDYRHLDNFFFVLCAYFTTHRQSFTSVFVRFFFVCNISFFSVTFSQSWWVKLFNLIIYLPIDNKLCLVFVAVCISIGLMSFWASEWCVLLLFFFLQKIMVNNKLEEKEYNFFFHY